MRTTISIVIDGKKISKTFGASTAQGFDNLARITAMQLIQRAKKDLQPGVEAGRKVSIQ